MRIACRVLEYREADGAENMAIDEALLDEVAEAPAGAAPEAVLRTYGWTRPTLSLGYFQSITEAERQERLRGSPIVRRPTGGGALWHDREVTYALVLPRTHPLAHRATDLYRAVHEAIAAGLRLRGVDAHRRCEREPAGLEKEKNRPFFCFTDRDAQDIVLLGVKIVGSAQRRRSGAVLQHGSLLLLRSTLTPELPGLGDLTDLPTDPQVWSTWLVGTIAAALAFDVHAEAQGLSAREHERASHLRHRVYSDPAWTRRR